MGMNPGGGQVLVSQDLLDQTQVFSGPELVGQNEFHVGLAQPDDTRRECSGWRRGRRNSWFRLPRLDKKRLG